MAGFVVTINADELRKLSDDLGALDAQRLGQTVMNTVNRVAERTFDTARDKMISGINLSDAYLRERMKLTLATEPANPRAIITARRRNTTLGRYVPKQLMQPVKHPRRSKGDKLRGIPPGLKAAGLSVEVTRGRRKPISYAFLMPMRRGTADGANGLGVFERTGTGKKAYRPMYGPSVYQLFRTTVAGQYDDIERDLRETVADDVRAELQRALG